MLVVRLLYKPCQNFGVGKDISMHTKVPYYNTLCGPTWNHHCASWRGCFALFFYKAVPFLPISLWDLLEDVTFSSLWIDPVILLFTFYFIHLLVRFRGLFWCIFDQNYFFSTPYVIPVTQFGYGFLCWLHLLDIP